MRVAHLTTVDISLALLLGPELREDVAEGLEVVAISAPGPFVPQVEALGTRHVPIPSFTRTWSLRADLGAARELVRALKALDLDVLHTHTPKAGVIGRVAGRLARVPVVVNTCHGLWASPDDRLLKRAAVVSIEAVAGWFSHAELYQNDEDRRRMRRFVRSRKARTVGNGVDLDRFRPDAGARARVRAELGLGEDEVLVGGIGRVVAEKGVAEFAGAAGALAGRARFVWIGPREERLDIAPVEHINFRDDIEAVHAALDVFVLPSYREGFSRSAMEAAAVGTAMVLTDIRGCREIGAGVLVPPRDTQALTRAVAALIDDPDRRASLGAAARERALAAFDQRAVARASIAAYRELLG